MVFLRMFLFCTLTALLGGCVGIRERGKIIFLNQHIVFTALTEATVAAVVDGNRVLENKLYAAEDKLNEACRPFQKKAYQELNNGTSDVADSDIYNAFDGCEKTSQEVKELVSQTYPDIARYYFEK